MNRDVEKNVGCSPETSEQAAFRHFGFADDAVREMTSVVGGIETVYGPVLAGVLFRIRDHIDAEVSEARWAVGRALIDRDNAMEQLRADKQHHIEHLVQTRSQRTVALAGVAEQLALAVNHVKERARKAGRPEPEWCAKADVALGQAQELLKS